MRITLNLDILRLIFTFQIIIVSKGLMGKEGRQAVRCADFAFARFRFLRKVLLVHGHWYYWRVSTLVQYFFYKNIAFITPVVFFTIYSAYSTQVTYIYFLLFPYSSLNCNFSFISILAGLRFVLSNVLQHPFYLFANSHLRVIRTEFYSTATS